MSVAFSITHIAQCRPCQRDEHARCIGRKPNLQCDEPNCFIQCECKHYQCAICHGFFTPAWTAEEAEAEYKEKFGHLPEDLFKDRYVVCDDCWKKAGFDQL